MVWIDDKSGTGSTTLAGTSIRCTQKKVRHMRTELWRHAGMKKPFTCLFNIVDSDNMVTTGHQEPWCWHGSRGIFLALEWEGYDFQRWPHKISHLAYSLPPRMMPNWQRVIALISRTGFRPVTPNVVTNASVAVICFNDCCGIDI